jgi:hypothetical protein
MMERRRLLPARATAVISLISFGLGPGGCTSVNWRAKPITDVSLARDGIESEDVRITTQDGMVQLHVTRVDFPYIYGSVKGSAGAIVAVDLREVQKAAAIALDPASKAVSQRSISTDAEAVRAVTPGTVHFTTSSGAVRMAVRRVEPPWVYGVPEAGTSQVRIDLREARALEVRKRSLSLARTAGLVLAGAVLIGIIAAVASSTPKQTTPESCPFVYVDRGEGWERVGLAYVGAAFRSIQRDDLLPLPSLPPGEVRVRLRDEAHETEYTDRVELVVVDHAADVRALATFDGQVVLATEGRGPREAHDGAGRAVTTLVGAADGSAWETDVVEVSQASRPFGEQLTAAFAAPPGPGAPVLEIVGGNTLWMDIVFDRFFGAMGSHLGRYLASGNQASRRTSLLAWREREGVDLTVEVLEWGRWRKVATVPTVGAEALRHVAVPLPADIAVAAPSLTVRLRGGLGFWRVDRLALSRRADAAATTLRLAPGLAVDVEGRDQREILAAADERYHVLQPGESVDLGFRPPPAAEGRMRTAFLLTKGYYNVHAPIQGKWSPGTLRAIRSEPGGLSRFSRDLASGYVRLAQRGPRTAEAAGGAR